MVGLAQYFNDTEFRKLLTEIKQVLNDDGKVYIKEQHTCSDTALTEENDWVRSLPCFKSAFYDTGFESQLVSRYSWDSKHCTNLSFVLKPADVPVFQNKTKWRTCGKGCDCFTLVHDKSCEGYPVLKLKKSKSESSNNSISDSNNVNNNDSISDSNSVKNEMLQVKT